MQRSTNVIKSCLVLLAASSVCFGQSGQLTPQSTSLPESDLRSFEEIFGGQHITGDVLRTHHQAMRLSPADRLLWLESKVFPGHVPFRVSIDFTPSHPLIAESAHDPVDGVRIEAARKNGHVRVQTGGNLVSPVLDLIEAAQEPGQLEKLRSRIVDVTPVGIRQRREKLSLLTLVDISLEEFATANSHLSKLLVLANGADSIGDQTRSAETLAIYAGIFHEQTHELARELVTVLVMRFTPSSQFSQTRTLKQFLVSLAGRAKLMAASEKVGQTFDEQEFSKALSLENWSPASRVSARSRGLGCPPAQWRRRGNRIEKTVSHNADMLYFNAPLLGDFQILGDVDLFGNRDMSLLVAGKWIQPMPNHQTMTLGDLRGSSETAVIPTFEKIKGRAHARAEIRGDNFASFINGGKRLDSRLHTTRFPWVGIFSRSHTNGGAENIQISGEPIIPEEIILSETPGLDGWSSYFGNSVGEPSSQWSHEKVATVKEQIVGLHTPELAGSHTECLLNYQRPMIEDGSIEYEFLYRPGRVCVHPALDRLAFLLEPTGVRIHRISDGKYERLDIAPDNVFDEPANRRGAAELPLKPDQWNTIRFTLKDDDLFLFLNEQLVYQRKIEITNQRTFGLFHYADRNEARVRNVRWRGEWLREIASVEDQELSGKGTRFLDVRLPELSDTFEHDFAKDEFTPDRFKLITGLPNHVNRHPLGLRLSRAGEGGNRAVTISPRVSLRGDFDLTAGFTQFTPKLDRDEACAAIIAVRLQNRTNTECILARRAKRFTGRNDLNQMQATIAQQVGATLKRRQFGSMPMEAKSGRLRIARRGEKIYYLIAEGRSPEFRLVTAESVAADDVSYEGISLKMQSAGRESNSVVWTRLTIHAEQISGISVEALKHQEAEFDRQRELLTDSLQIDFEKQLQGKLLKPVKTDRRWSVDSNGQLIEQVPRVDEVVSTFALDKELGGDFDISIELAELTDLPPGQTRERSVRLQVPLSGNSESVVSIVCKDRPESKLEVSVESNERFGDNRFNTQSEARIEFGTVSALRVLRRAKVVTLLARDAETSPFRTVGKVTARSNRVAPSAVRLILSSKCVSSESPTPPFSVNSFSVHAKDIYPLEKDIVKLLVALEKQLVSTHPEYVLEFNGEDSFVKVPTLSPDGSQPMTYEAFVTPRQKGGIAVGNSSFSGTVGGAGIALMPKYNAHWWTGERFLSNFSTYPVELYLRTHIAGTFEGQTVNLFVNSRHVGTKVLPTLVKRRSLPVSIGGSPMGGNHVRYPLDGLIDQVRISETVRYKDSFSVPQNLNTDKDTLACYQFRKGSGTQLIDLSGNDHHGEIMRATWSTGSSINRQAAAGLARIGNRATPILIKAIDDEKATVRAAAAHGLGRLGNSSSSVRDALKKLNNDPDKDVRATAKRSLMALPAVSHERNNE